MNIGGFQKLTLLDFPGKVACTIFTGGCNLRCPFCHNALLVTKLEETEPYDTEEVLGYLKKRAGILEGVAITGGEPLLQKDIREFILKVRDLGYQIKLDTNGFFPDQLFSLVSDGLVDHVAVDIKNSREKYALTAGVEHLDLRPMEETVRYLLEGHVTYEFRTTLVNELHTLEDMRSIGEWIKGAEKYYLQKFVDSGCLIGEGFHEVPKSGMKEFLKTVTPYVQYAEIRGE